MALLDTLTSANMVTETGLTVRYNVTESGNGGLFLYTRTASKRYKYVGLTKEAALAGASEKMGKYTRNYAVPKTPPAGAQSGAYSESVTKCTTGIQPVHESGNMWSLQIAVDEQDVKCSTLDNLAPGTIFAAENSRDYDDGEGGALVLQVSSKGFHSGTLTVGFSYTSNLGDVPRDRVTAEIWTESAAAWTAAGIAWGIGRSGQITMTGTSASVFANALVRLCYGSYTSNEESCDPNA